MRRCLTLLGVLVAALALTGTASATVRVNALGLQMYTAKVSRATALRLVNEGYDVARVRMLTRGARVDRC